MDFSYYQFYKLAQIGYNSNKLQYSSKYCKSQNSLILHKAREVNGSSP